MHSQVSRKQVFCEKKKRKNGKSVCQPFSVRSLTQSLFQFFSHLFEWCQSHCNCFNNVRSLFVHYFRFNDRRVSTENAKQKTWILAYKRRETFYTHQTEEEQNDIMRRVSYKWFYFVCAEIFNFFC